MTKAHVNDLMTTPVRTIESDESIAGAASELIEHGIGSLIVNGDSIDGIITETDIVASVSDGLDPTTTAVGEVLSEPVVAIRPTDSLSTASERMTENEVAKLAITEDGDPVGIITTTDLAMAE